MADLKISQLTSATLPLAGTEVLPIVQSSSTKKVATDDLTVKNVRSNATTGILQIAGPGAGATRTMTTPNANFTAARTDAAQSFTGDQTLSTGNLIQGTAAKGVNFTANTPAAGMTSQLLDWYEEGTFTPTWGADGGSPTTTYTTNTGRYTKCGNVVTFAVYVLVNTVSGGAGTLRLYGLPFASAADTVSYAVTRGFVFNWVVNPKTYVIPAGTDSILIYADDTTNTIATPADLQANCYFVVSGSYRTAT